LEEIIQANQLKFAELAKEIGLLKEQQEPKDSTSRDLHRPRKLPAEMNREIFLCFNPATQRKFIWGLGWDFYDMFRQKVLIKVL
jgi:hypothetical protein